ncbi:MAG: PadR family transcriptional regulator [Halobacteriota archaeon]|nr:PadR family transcriptional regulator [Halobacteriota archaeon]
MKKSMLDRKFFLGFVRVHILYHASKEEIFGVEIMDELKKHGYDISPGTLYPILHSFEKEGLLKSRSENVGGKMRRYYRITEAGQGILDDARKKIQELVDEVME